MSSVIYQPGKCYAVGLGPGGIDQITPRAMAALKESQIIAGYTVYVDLIREHFPNKILLTTPMRKEIERCRMVLEESAKGKTVSIVCSGDPGIYGMAGLLYELAQQYPPIEIEVIPGITSAISGASVLGAPLMHDFAVISLSDLMTPMEQIEKRLEAAAAADFVLCLYNPSSQKRQDYLQGACDIILRHRSSDTVTGWVRNIGRAGETSQLLLLSELRNKQVDMFTTVWIGNSKTKELNGKMVTPRGYSIL